MGRMHSPQIMRTCLMARIVLIMVTMDIVLDNRIHELLWGGQLLLLLRCCVV
jgi:hypothetical protein